MMDFQPFQHSGTYTSPEDLAAATAGFFARQREHNAVHEARVDQFARLMAACASGDEDPIFLKEAFYPRRPALVNHIMENYPGVIKLSETMATSDYAQYLTTDVLDRVLWGYYTMTSIPVWSLVKRASLRDFRTVKRFQINGGRKPFDKLESKSMPALPPRERALTPVSPLTYNPEVYSGLMSIDWAALINDDLGIFNELAQAMTDSWNLTIWEAITNFYVDANGPNVNLFKSAWKNLVTTTYGATADNPALSFSGLSDAYTVIRKQLNEDSQPIQFQGSLKLTVGPALETTANLLRSAQQGQFSILGGNQAGSTGFPSAFLTARPTDVVPSFDVVVDQKMPLVCTTSGVRNTMWIFGYDAQAQARPPVEFGMLKGYDSPQLWQKVPQHQRVGGGVDPGMGNWETLQTDYKAIAIFGGTWGDGRSVVASKGTGTA